MCAIGSHLSKKYSGRLVRYVKFSFHLPKILETQYRRGE